MSDENVLVSDHSTLHRSFSSGSIHSHSGMSVASYAMSIGGDARFLTFEPDACSDRGKGIWNASLMLGVGVHGLGDDGLQLELVPTNVKPYNIDRRVADLLRVISPSPIALEYCSSVLHFISGLVKQALGARSFAIGGFALNTYLPDEDISLCTFLCRGKEPTWCIKVNELLCKESSNRVCARESGSGNSREGKRDVSSPSIGCVKGGGGGESCASSKKTCHHMHQLSYVNFINSYPYQRISCAVDNKVAVKVTANCLDDIVLYVFYEEVNQLLGKDHLFKQSILLIKAWWLYESRTYTGFKMMNHVNEETLLALVFAVVNVHHKRLHTPLQVFAMFFHVYGTLPWEDVVVGPAGPVPRHTYGPCTASTYPPFALVSYDKITLYIDRLKGIECSKQGMQRKQRLAPDPSGGVIIEQGGGNSRTDTTPMGQKLTWEGTMVVVHPLVPEMSIIWKWGRTPEAKWVIQIINMSARRLQQLFLSLQCETSRAQATQRQPPSNHLESTSIAMLDTFFGLTWARFRQGWRPDVWNRLEEHSDADSLLTDHTSAWSIPSGVLHVDLYELHQYVDYCSLMLQEEVTEGGILSLAYHILEERGAIPVGEIGKLLQDATLMPHLSRILKEKYGGLKRFLERHSEVFYMSNDHPFNPCVCIRERMAELDVENAARPSRGGTDIGGKICGGNNKNVKWKNQKK